MEFVVLFTNLPAACGLLPGVSLRVLDRGAERRALAFVETQFGVRPDGRFGQRVAAGLWTVWNYGLHDHWRGGREEFFFERFEVSGGRVARLSRSGPDPAAVCALAPPDLAALFGLGPVAALRRDRGLSLASALRQARARPLPLPRVKVGRLPSAGAAQAPVNEKMVGAAQALLAVLAVFAFKAAAVHRALAGPQ